MMETIRKILSLLSVWVKKAAPYSRYIFYVCVFIFYSAMLYQCGKRHAEKGGESVKTEIKYIQHKDTSPKLSCEKQIGWFPFVAHHSSVSKSKVLVQTKLVHDTIPDHDTIQIPITQKTYTGSNYAAYVSGFEQSLDSINVRERVVTNTITKWRKRSRWNVGVSAGYGINQKGLTPYIGVGVTYNIFR